MLSSIKTTFWSTREYLAPVLKDSKFKESGRLTPDEFVLSGDYLVYKFPTWSWEAGDSSKRKDYLPADKQYLVQRNVPCLRRASQLSYSDSPETFLSFDLDPTSPHAPASEDDWVATHSASLTPASTSSSSSNTLAVSKREAQFEAGDIPDADLEGLVQGIEGLSPAGGGGSTGGSGSALGSGGGGRSGEEMPNLDDIPDMDDDDEGGARVVEEEDEAELKPASASGGGGIGAPSAAVASSLNNGNLIQVRTYDCSITYDKYYQTPRMWLLGYDEHKSPLPPASAFSDISSEHAQKTVTIEPFPHSSLSMASVHPCKHSSVMKKVIERMDKSVVEAQRKGFFSSGGGGGGGRKVSGGGVPKGKEGEGGSGEEEVQGLRVDQYLVVFLKFISSIVPTIEVDATNSI